MASPAQLKDTRLPIVQRPRRTRAVMTTCALCLLLAQSWTQPSTASAAAPTAALATDDTAAPLLTVGAVAPDFSTTAHDGKKVSLSALKGQQVVLYFYPKDDTPGCTKEACEIRDTWAALQKAGVVVFGVSTQNSASHKAFAEKYKLPFPLLSDEQGQIAARYHVPVVAGKARRITYLIDTNGKIKYVWPNVNPIGHAADILAHASAR